VAIAKLLESQPPGKDVEIVVLRDGRQTTLHAASIDERAMEEMQLVGPTPPPLPAIDTAGAPSAFSIDFGARAGDGRLPEGLVPFQGRWHVVEPPNPVYGHAVLRQDLTTLPWAVLLVAGPGRAYRDGKVRVRFMPLSGITDGSGGIIFRAQDGKNYYVARANALEDNYGIYVVKDGVRTELRSVEKVTMPPFHTWSDMEVTFQGDHLSATLDGGYRVEVTDNTFASGWSGLWTKADSDTLFEGFQAEPLR